MTSIIPSQAIELPHEMTTTGFELPGFRIHMSLGVVRGVVVRSRSVFGTIGASFQTLVGGTHVEVTRAESRGGATGHAARALGLSDRGRLEPGMRADLARWRVRHPSELAYWLGGELLAELFVAGKTTKPR